MTIRSEQPGDIDAIERLTYQAFLNHPHHEPGTTPTEHLIVNRLRDAAALTLSLVAEQGEQIVGHIAISPVHIDSQEHGWVGLGPVSVLPSEQGKGIGRALIVAALAQLTVQGIAGVVLLGEPELYQRFGFANQAGLTLEGVPPEYFLAQSLDESKPLPSGSVSYHQGFYG